MSHVREHCDVPKLGRWRRPRDGSTWACTCGMLWVLETRRTTAGEWYNWASIGNPALMRREIEDLQCQIMELCEREDNRCAPPF